MPGCRRRHLIPEYVGEAYPGLFEDCTIGQHATLATTAAGALPAVPGECRPAIQLLQLVTDASLQSLQIVFYLINIAQTLVLSISGVAILPRLPKCEFLMAPKMDRSHRARRSLLEQRTGGEGWPGLLLRLDR